jgi:hypothetical protein
MQVFYFSGTFHYNISPHSNGAPIFFSRQTAAGMRHILYQEDAAFS